MWVEFRKKHLRFIYVPILNFIANPFATFRTRRYIKNMVKNFINELNKSQGTHIHIVYNNADSPPTYGDFMISVMLGRFLALSGHQMSFTILDAARRDDWKDLAEKDQEILVQEHLRLAEFLLPTSVRVKVVQEFTQKATELILNSASFYGSAPYFLDLLITKYKWKIPQDFLLTHEKNIDMKPYIAWHIRRGLWDSRRDSTSASIQSDFQILRNRFPNHSIMLFSNTAGLNNAYLALTGRDEVRISEIDGVQLLPQPVPGFQNAIPYVLAADFYFQRSGGGLGIIPMFSSVPYINICPDKTYFHGRNGHSIVPWADDNQLFIYTKDNIHSFSIERLLESLGVL